MLATKTEPHAKALAEVLNVPWSQGGLLPREARRLVLVVLSENPSPPTTIPYLCKALSLKERLQVDKLRRVVRDLYGSGYLRRYRCDGGLYVYRVTVSGMVRIRELEGAQS